MGSASPSAAAVGSRSFEALNQLGLLRFQQGGHEDALGHFRAASQLKPHDPQTLAHLGTVEAAMGNAQGALETFLNVVALLPAHAEALYNCGNMLQNLGRPAEALTYFDRALAANPRLAEAHNNKGNALRQLGRVDAALESFAKAVATKPRLAEGHYNAAGLLSELGRREEALVAYGAALDINPDFAQGHVLRGNLLRDLNRLRPSVEAYQKAIALEPKNAIWRILLGDTLKDMGRPDEALRHYDGAVAANPDFAEGHDRRGLVLTDLGRLDAARLAHKKAIELAPRKAPFYYNLAQVTTLAADDRHFQAMKELARDMKSLDPGDEIPLRFALAKALDENGDHDTSARHLFEANAQQRRQVSYDEKITLAGMGDMKTLFTPELTRAVDRAGDPSNAPVFIVGMPRSGSTLVEQILSSHPEAFGAGEITDFADALNEVLGQKWEAARFSIARGDELRAELREIGTNYVNRIRRLAPSSRRVINKMPDNFRFAGLIHMALPNARIIHTRRDPLDTCVSCFSKLFTAGLPYTFDLRELGRYYRAYHDLMAHWRATLPKDVMLELSYEELVAGLETQSRRIVQHCGLAWDPLCLDFPRNARPVHTASASQVRQPIRADSVGRWRVYEEYLGPLIAALGPSIVTGVPVHSPGSRILGRMKAFARAIRPTIAVRA